MDKKEAAEHNAMAWLILTDDELVDRSASLGHDPNYNSDNTQAEATPTAEEIIAMRKNADDFAREHAGDAFVNKWIKENRNKP